MEIKGEMINLLIRIENYTIKLPRVLIFSKRSNNILIGADAISQSPELIKILIQKVSPQYLPKIVAINNTSTNSKTVSLVEDYKMIFDDQIRKDTICQVGQHSIDMTDNKPLTIRNSKIPIHWEAEINKEIEKLLNSGVKEPSNSPWCSRIQPVSKPDGTIRLCIDYRPLNSKARRDNYPIPRIDEILDNLSNSKVFTTLDATSVFHQIGLSEDSKEKTAFAWKNGLYQFTRMPFSLCNAPATFQRIMDKIFRNEIGKFVIPYFDDIIIFSKNIEEHEEHLKTIFNKIKSNHLRLNLKKCKFAQESVKILGNIVSHRKITLDPSKIQAIKERNLPLKINDLRSFLGLANYCRSFLPKFAHIAAPLFNLLKGESKRSKKTIQWDSSSSTAFYDLKKTLNNSTVRSQPDVTKKFILTTDASDIGIGAILSQINDNGKEQMISAFSKALDDTQRKYGITDRELLAVVKSIDHFRSYLLGKRFELRTDHKALTYLWTAKDPTTHLLRWEMKLQEYDFEVKYIKSEENEADLLSRGLECNNATINKQLDIKNQDTQQKILNEYHSISGHGSANVLKFLLKDKYTWPNMFKDIEQKVRACKTCLKAGTARVNTKNKIIKTEYENELWECDIIGRFPQTLKKNKFILVLIDHYSKWIEAIPLKHKSAEEVVKAINHIIGKYGVPKRIISDSGL